MWYLKQDSATYFLLGGPGCSFRFVGRKDADIRLKSKHISRQHASIKVHRLRESGSLEYVDYKTFTYVEITDLSAYGTFVKHPDFNQGSQHIRLNKDEPTRLDDTAQVSFGAPSEQWMTILYENFVVLPSLKPSIVDGDQSGKKDLLQLLIDLGDSAGFEIATKFSSNVTHVISQEPNAYCPFVLLALIHNIPIVNSAWVEAVEEKVRINFHVSSGNADYIKEDFPNVNLYFPLRDKLSASLDDDDSDYVLLEQSDFFAQSSLRKNLFSNFCFLVDDDALYQEYKQVLIDTGAVVRLYVSRSCLDDAFIRNEISFCRACVLCYKKLSTKKSTDLSDLQALLSEKQKQDIKISTISFIQIIKAIIHSNTKDIEASLVSLRAFLSDEKMKSDDNIDVLSSSDVDTEAPEEPREEPPENENVGAGDLHKGGLQIAPAEKIITFVAKAQLKPGDYPGFFKRRRSSGDNDRALENINPNVNPPQEYIDINTRRSDREVDFRVFKKNPIISSINIPCHTLKYDPLE